MKTLKYYALGLLAIAGLTLQSCSSDDHYDVEGSSSNYVYIDHHSPSLFNFEVLHTPVGDFGDVAISLPVKLQYAVENDVNVYATIDNTLVATYNEENETEYATIPQTVISAIETTSTVIKKGAYESVEPLTLTIPNEVLPQLTEEYYVLPVRVTSFAKTGVKGSEEHGIAYVVLHTSANLARFTTTSTSSGIVRTPVGVFGSVAGDYNVALQEAIPSALTVTMVPNTELVGDYNIDNGTSYVALPQNVISALEITPAVVAAGAQSGTIHVSVPDAVAQTLTEPGYILPFNLKYTYETGDVVTDEEQVAYLIVTTQEKLINEGAGPSSMLGSVIATSEVLTWTVDHDEMSSITNAGDWYTWDSGTYEIDMQTVHNITGLRFQPPYASYAWDCTVSVSLSEDGSTWVDCGSTSAMNKTSNWYYYVLYGGVPARYMKLTFSTNLWNYYDWGFDGIQFYAE